MAYKFFDKESSGSGVDAEPKYQLANELHRQIIRKSQKSVNQIKYRLVKAVNFIISFLRDF